MYRFPESTRKFYVYGTFVLLSMDNLTVGQKDWSICCQLGFDKYLRRFQIDFIKLIHFISYINTHFRTFKLIIKNNYCAVNIIPRRCFKRYVNPSSAVLCFDSTHQKIKQINLALVNSGVS